MRSQRWYKRETFDGADIIARVVIPLCGGNIDTTILGRCLDRGLAADGRLVKFTVKVSDRPGGIAELAKLLTTCGVSIKDIVHERAWIKNDIFSVEVGDLFVMYSSSKGSVEVEADYNFRSLSQQR